MARWISCFAEAATRNSMRSRLSSRPVGGLPTACLRRGDGMWHSFAIRHVALFCDQVREIAVHGKSGFGSTASHVASVRRPRVNAQLLGYTRPIRPMVGTALKGKDHGHRIASAPVARGEDQASECR